MQVGRTNRRAFITGLGGAAALPVLVRGQQPSALIGYLFSASSTSATPGGCFSGRIARIWLYPRTERIDRISLG